MELTQALEAPLLGAHPNPPDAGNIKYYTLLADLREYVQFDSGEFQYRNPRTWKWHAYYNGTTAGAQWMRNTDGNPQSRRTNFLTPFTLSRLSFLTFSSRNDLNAASSIYVRIYEDDIDAAGDIRTGDPITFEIFSDDAGVTSYRNGKRFLIDLRAQNVELDPQKRYAIRIDNVGDGAAYRDVKVEFEIEERAVNP